MKKLLLIICLSLPLAAAQKRSLESDDIGTPAKRVETDQPSEAPSRIVPLMDNAAIVLAQNLASNEQSVLSMPDDAFMRLRDWFFKIYRKEILATTKTLGKEKQRDIQALFEPTRISEVPKFDLFTPDSTKLVGHYYGDLYVMNLVSGEVQSMSIDFDEDDDHIDKFSSVDNKNVLALTDSGFLLVFDITQKPFLRTTIDPFSTKINDAIKVVLGDLSADDPDNYFIRRVNTAFMSPDNNYIVVVANEGAIILFFDSAGTLVQTYIHDEGMVQEMHRDQSWLDKVRVLVVAPDKNKILYDSVSDNLELIIIDYNKVGTRGVIVYQGIGGTSPSHNISFSPNSQQIMINPYDEGSFIYDIETGRRRRIPSIGKWLHDQDVFYDSDNQYSTLRTGVWRVPNGSSEYKWNATTGKKQFIFTDYGDKKAFAINVMDGIVAIFFANRIQFFDDQGNLLGYLDAKVVLNEYYKPMFSPNGRYLYVKDSNRHNYLYDFQSQKLQEGLARNPAALIELAKEIEVSGFKKPIAEQ